MDLAASRRGGALKMRQPISMVAVMALAGIIISAGGESQARSPVDNGGSPDRGEDESSGKPEEVPALTPPELLSGGQAVYPERAMAEGLEAEVLLEIDIDADGQVEGVTVIGPADPPGYGFDEAAVDAANLFEFRPAMEGGTPVPVRITYRYRFQIETVEAADPADGAARTDRSDAVEGATDRAAVINLAGEIRERGTRLPVPGALVTVFKGDGEQAIGFESTTDSDGRFAFYDLEPGTWRILSEPDGYFPLRTSEELAKGERIDAVFLIEKASYNPFDVLVEGQRPRKEVSRTSLQVEEIEKVPGTFGDVLAVIQNLPGVARTGPVGGDIVVRGSSPEDTQVFVDGINVPIIYHFGGLRSVIPLGMLEGIDFYPGNFSAEYSRATGGIIDVRLKDLDPEKIGGYLDLNLIDAGVYLEAPIGDKVAIAVAARRSYIDSFLGAVVPDDAPVNLITAPRYYDYQLLATFRPTSAHRISAFFFGSDDELKLLFENPADLSPDFRATDASTSTSFYRTVLQWRYTPDERVSNDLRISGGRNWIYFGIGDQFYLDLNNYVAQVRDTLRISLSDEIAIAAGIDYLYSKSDARIKFPPISKEGEAGGMPDLDESLYTAGKALAYHSMGGFMEVEARFFDRLLLVPGIRYDYFSRVDQSSLAPRFNARLGVGDRWTLKGGVGLFFQEPSFDETTEGFGNPELGLEKAVHYSAGVEFKPLPHLTLDVTGFYKDLGNLVSRTEATELSGGEISPLVYDNGGVGRVYGLELLARHDFSNHFSGWVSYTLSRAERRDTGADAWRLFDYDQTHILTVLGTYHLPKNWSVGMRWRLVSGSPFTPREGAVYVVDDGMYAPVYGDANSRRLPAFHQLDIRIDKRWVFDNWMLTAYLDLQNAYNQQNVTGYSYNYDSTQSRARQSLPILPVIGLKGEF